MLVLTFLKMPASTSQAVVGALIGIGLWNHSANFEPLVKVGLCWVATPVGGALLAYVLYRVVGSLFQRYVRNIRRFDTVIYVRETTCSTGTEAGCDDDSGTSTGASSLRVRLSSGTWYVFVDGDYSYSYGSISLTVSGI